MYNVTLTKISSNPNALRDSTVSGMCDLLPKEGQSFMMTAPPRDSGDLRMVRTNIVTEVEEEGGIYTFKTASGSIYRVVRN